ncbi:DNA repair protein [Dacryopinax primogenitus]|uniref:DNA repair protein RAD14 n=1 Tax=Dacryopinax primogenitus (strain DJM 731) TaxID=1858805 RepID=M5GAS1_DACPD|nr:DNA repair protein [Dacryopinax primogenitus]EJU01028.1 DNA repair protein [Dacryopinax primogenitus]
MSRPSTPPPRVAAPAAVPITPPPRPGVTERNVALTPEQVKQVEINRLKAKARLKKSERQRSEAGPSTTPNSNNKRPLTVTPWNSTSPTVPSKFQGPSTSKPEAPLPRDSWLGTYYEYDLSKMVNTKGGFLTEAEKGEAEKAQETRRKELERERERMKQNFDPPVFMNASKNPRCEQCGTIDIDHQYNKVYGVRVCAQCKDKFPELYSLLTKTECKADYLLTDSELRDETAMPHLLKANPHSATYNNMMLFLRKQVEAFAWEKWGGPKGLDAEWARREEGKKAKRGKKFEEKLRELRRRTRGNVWQKRKDQEHKHVFGLVVEGEQRCEECGFKVEVEEL